MRSYVRHKSCICVTWLIHMCDRTHSWVQHDSCICVTWLIDMCGMTHSFTEMRLIHMCGITPSESHFLIFLWVSSLIFFFNIYDETHSYVRHDSFICAAWHIHSQRWDWFICAAWLLLSRVFNLLKLDSEERLLLLKNAREVFLLSRVFKSFILSRVFNLCESCHLSL